MRPGERGAYARCTDCGFIRGRNPAVGVAVVVRDSQGRVLLGERATGPYAGLWCIPCGYVEWHEDIREAGMREFEEETGLAVELAGIVAVHSNFHNPKQHTVGVWFAGIVRGGHLHPADGELTDLAYFDPAGPPALAFPTDALVLAELVAPAARPLGTNLFKEYPGGRRTDVTPLFRDGPALVAVANYLAKPFRGEVDAVAAIDALGFVLGTAVALALGCGVVTIRKGGKLPGPVESRNFTDYSNTEKALEVSSDADLSGLRVLVVDEWIETGAQVTAAIQLLEAAGAMVAGIATLNVDDNEATRAIASRYRVHSLGRGQ